jgi:hypothetical protein
MSEEQESGESAGATHASGKGKKRLERAWDALLAAGFADGMVQEARILTNSAAKMLNGVAPQASRRGPRSEPHRPFRGSRGQCSMGPGKGLR